MNTNTTRLLQSPNLTIVQFWWHIFWDNTHRKAQKTAKQKKYKQHYSGNPKTRLWARASRWSERAPFLVLSLTPWSILMDTHRNCRINLSRTLIFLLAGGFPPFRPRPFGISVTASIWRLGYASLSSPRTDTCRFVVWTVTITGHTAIEAFSADYHSGRAWGRYNTIREDSISLLQTIQRETLTCCQCSTYLAQKGR